MPVDIPVNGMPSPVLSGTGVPSLIYNADAAMQGIVYIQTDGPPGQRLWFCYGANGIYIWELVRGMVSAITTPAVTASFALVGSTYSGSVNIAAAALGMTARMEPIGGDPGSILISCWVQTPGVVNYRLTNLTTANMSLSSMNFAIYLSKP